MNGEFNTDLTRNPLHCRQLSKCTLDEKKKVRKNVKANKSSSLDLGVVTVRIDDRLSRDELRILQHNSR